MAKWHVAVALLQFNARYRAALARMREYGAPNGYSQYDYSRAQRALVSTKGLFTAPNVQRPFFSWPVLCGRPAVLSTGAAVQ